MCDSVAVCPQSCSDDDVQFKDGAAFMSPAAITGHNLQTPAPAHSEVQINMAVDAVNTPPWRSTDVAIRMATSIMWI